MIEVRLDAAVQHAKVARRQETWMEQIGAVATDEALERLPLFFAARRLEYRQTQLSMSSFHSTRNGSTNRSSSASSTSITLGQQGRQPSSGDRTLSTDAWNAV
jgi:hypothetical protein